MYGDDPKKFIVRLNAQTDRLALSIANKAAMMRGWVQDPSARGLGLYQIEASENKRVYEIQYTSGRNEHYRIQVELTTDTAGEWTVGYVRTLAPYEFDSWVCASVEIEYFSDRGNRLLEPKISIGDLPR